MEINIFEADCGAGKTYALGFEVDRLVSEGFHVLYCLPTKQVIDEVEKDLKNRFPHLFIYSIYSDDNRGSIGRIKTAFRDNSAEIDVLLITASAFERLEDLYKPEEWQLICDEVPSACHFLSTNIPNTHKLITKHIALSTWAGDPTNQYKLIQKKNKKLQLIAKNKNKDAIYATLSDAARFIDSQNYDVVVKASNYASLLTPAKGRSVKFSCLALIKPELFSQFSGVLIASASVKSSLLYKIFSNVWNFSFVETHNLDRHLRYHSHENSHLINIYYASERDFSIRYGSEPGNMEILAKAALNAMGTSKFVWIENGHNPNPVEYGPNGTKISSYPHGINEYKTHTGFVSLAAFNIDSNHQSFLKDVCSVSYDEARNAIHNEMHYQAACRISIRDPSNTTQSKVFVPDLSTAEFLKTRFPNASISKVAVKLNGDHQPKKGGRPAKHENPAERQRAYKQRKDKERRDNIDRLRSICSSSNSPHHDMDLDENTPVTHSMINYFDSENPNYSDEIFKFNNGFVTQFYASIYERVSINKSLTNVVGWNLSDFEDFLKELSTDVKPSKEDNIAFCPSLFTDGIRNKDNIVGCGSIFLDQDGGIFTPRDIMNIFSGIRMTVYSSYSDTKSKRKFRIFIPFQGYVTSDEFALIAGHLKTLIMDYAEQNNIKPSNDGTHYGFDKRCFTPFQLMYAPCKPANASSYCRIHRGKSRSILNPRPIIEKRLKMAMEAEEALALRTQPIFDLRNDERAGAAINKWHSICEVPGMGNAGFFELGKELYCSGYDRSEVKTILERQAAFARSPDERLRQIKSILDNCDSYRRKLGKAA